MKLEVRRGATSAIGVASVIALTGAITGACGGDKGGSGGGSSTSTSASTVTASATSGSNGSSGQGGATTSSTTGDTTGSGGQGGHGGQGPHLADWVRTFPGSEQSAASVAADAQGNVYVGGMFANGMVDFGAGQLDCPIDPMGYRWCGFLLKLDPTGKTLWSRAFVASHSPSINVTALGVGADGVVMAAAWQRYQVQHGALDAGTGPLNPPGDNPMVLAKFDPSGVPVWSAAFGDAGGDVVPTAIVVEGPGKFTLGGGFTTPTLDLGAGPMPYVGTHTLFLAHFDDKTVGWQKSYGGPMSQELGGLARTPQGELVLAGSFNSSLDFGGPALMSMQAGSIFQAKLGATGAFVADQSYDSSGPSATVNGVAADAVGDALFTGKLDGTLGLGAMPLSGQGGVNGYLAKLDAQGKVAFTQVSAEPMTAQDGYYYVAADASNNVLWGAYVYLTDATGDSIAGRVSKLDPSGATLWSISGKDFGTNAITADSSANVLAVGDFSNELDFAKSGPILATKGTNAFIAKFSP